jgi:hypothetical protein
MEDVTKQVAVSTSEGEAALRILHRLEPSCSRRPPDEGPAQWLCGARPIWAGLRQMAHARCGAGMQQAESAAPASSFEEGAS